MREERTEVLVVGAGPVGLWTALLLAEAGIETCIVDREQRVAARSYACALHPRTLKLLAALKLADPVIDQGRRISKVAFYDRTTCRAEVKLSALDPDYPFLLVLPQNVLEGLLEDRLAQAGVKVRWNCRFDSFEHEVEMVAATLEELEGTSTGYIVPHWETVVKERWPLRARFILGADGHYSLVRQRAGIPFERSGGPYHFAAYEFESDRAGEDEVRVVLEEGTTNVLWPLPDNRFRWTFQMLHTETAKEFPGKERRQARWSPAVVDEEIRNYIERVSHHRAPWFSAPVKQIAWCSGVVFEQRLAQAFGRGRCWLLGDAAHQTGPVGVQSMNAGFAEAESLTAKVRCILQEDAPMEVLAAYEREQQAEWRGLLGLAGGLKAIDGTENWVREHAAEILPCLPATGGEVNRLAGQLRMELLSPGPPAVTAVPSGQA